MSFRIRSSERVLQRCWHPARNIQGVQELLQNVSSAPRKTLQHRQSEEAGLPWRYSESPCPV